MNRLTFIVLSAVLCLVPFFFFGGVQRATGGGYNDGYSRGYYRRGPSFLFMSFGNNYGYSRSRSRGRGYSSGGFRGGGSRFGK